MTLRTQRTAMLLILAVFAYGGSYLLFRTTHLSRTAEVGEFEIIVPQGQLAFYYIFRPLVYLDVAATGVRCHIGPHQLGTPRSPR
jgi:hypothetical protein